MFPKSRKLTWTLVLGLAFLVAACATAPYTGRRQLLLTSEGGETAMGFQAFQQAKQQVPICQDPALNEMVLRVGQRLAAAANRPDYRWEFVVFYNDQEANAFCLPGGKVGVFTGLLKYAQDEAGLATIMAHEAGHALARHAGERLSQSMLTQVGGLGLGLGLGGVNPAAGQAIMQGYSLGTQMGILLPYNRSQEFEADRIGMILLAKAGYPPEEALIFWKRMLTRPPGPNPPQFLSTHPRDEDRLQKMAEFLPEAQKYYIAVAAAPAAPASPARPRLEPQPAPAPPPPPEIGQKPAPPPGQEPRPRLGQEPGPPPTEPPLKDEDLELSPMSTGSATAQVPPGAPCGQWVPLHK